MTVELKPQSAVSWYCCVAFVLFLVIINEQNDWFRRLDFFVLDEILTAPPWRTGGPGRPHITWMKTIQQDLKSNNLSLNEAIDVAQNHPLGRLMSTFGATHS